MISLCEFTIYLRKSFFILYSLSIRRVRNYKSILFRVAKLAYRPALEVNKMLYIRFFGILTCNSYHLLVNIVTLDVCFNLQIKIIISFCHRIIPAFLWNKVSPLLCCKVSVHARSHIGCHHCRFYWKGSASAERINQYSV